MTSNPAPTSDASSASDEEFIEGRYVPPRWRPETKSSYVLGVDLAQSVDRTALALIERRVVYSMTARDTTRRPGAPELRLSYLERLPLGTDYIDQSTMIAERLAAVPGRCVLGVDQTGLGKPVVDLLRRNGVELRGITITSSETSTQASGGWRVGKLELISLLQAKLHSGELRISKSLPLADELKRELQSFGFKYNAAGFLSYGARASAHDDLVLATAIAVFLSEKGSRQIQVVGLRGL